MAMAMVWPILYRVIHVTCSLKVIVASCKFGYVEIIFTRATPSQLPKSRHFHVYNETS